MSNQHEASMPSKVPPSVMPRLTKFVTVPAFALIAGYTQKAVYRKIEDGVWRQDVHYVRAPDGRLLISLDGYESWAVGK
jgi:hypothetical protein